MERLKRHISRVVTFDLMRGYFMVAIIIDHLRFFPNGLDWWSARGGLFVTAAEGFFLISGIVLGIVRGSKLIEKPMRVVSAVLLKRGVQLYLTAVTLILIFTVVGWQFYGVDGLKSGILPPDTNVWTVLWSAFSMQYYYGWADYLRLYAIFLLVSPLVFWMLRRGWWYLVLALSLFVWTLYPNIPGMSFGMREYLQPVSWQLLFFLGAIIGFHWNHFLDGWRALSRRTQRWLTVSLLTVAGVTFLINVGIMLSTMGYNMGPLTPQLQHDLYVNFFNKERMPITRVLLALVWFWSGFYLFKKFEKPIVKLLGWLLLPFGTNSLYVYTLHAFAVFFVDLYLSPGPLWFNFLITTGVIIAIRLAVQYKLLMKIIPR